MANIENVKKWIAALRSGEYTQGTGALHKQADEDGKPDTFCCLGVACDVALKQGIPLSRKAPGNYSRNYRYHGVDNPDGWTTGILPAPVSAWLGLDGRDITEGSVVFDEDAVSGTIDGVPRDAIFANDALKWSFDQIADKLEDHFGLKGELANA
jgi:hypothetical protein